jgi:hypothetical protein
MGPEARPEGALLGNAGPQQGAWDLARTLRRPLRKAPRTVPCAVFSRPLALLLCVSVASSTAPRSIRGRALKYDPSQGPSQGPSKRTIVRARAIWTVPFPFWASLALAPAPRTGPVQGQDGRALEALWQYKVRSRVAYSHTGLNQSDMGGMGSHAAARLSEKENLERICLDTAFIERDAGTSTYRLRSSEGLYTSGLWTGPRGRGAGGLHRGPAKVTCKTSLKGPIKSPRFLAGALTGSVKAPRTGRVPRKGPLCGTAPLLRPQSAVRGRASRAPLLRALVSVCPARPKGPSHGASCTGRGLWAVPSKTPSGGPLVRPLVRALTSPLALDSRSCTLPSKARVLARALFETLLSALPRRGQEQ